MILADKLEKRFGPQVLFQELNWQILPGQRIGLVGPNGAGKTTLVRILAGVDSPDDGRVRKARSIRIGYLPQEVMDLSGETILEEALAGHGEVTELEHRLHVLEHDMADAGDGERAAHLAEEYGTAQERFAALGGYDLESRARTVLTGLGFDPERLDRPVGELSGGWQMRVALARLLLQDPDLLLLDEPTNHLDIESLDWLEEFLLTRETAFVVISHDRYFLNRMVTQVAELSSGRLTLFTGNYDRYLVDKERRFAQVEAAARQQAKEMEKAQRFIERFRAQATKARQVQSRVKMLERMEKIKTPVRDNQSVRFRFPQPPRGGAVTIQVEDLVKRYGDNVVYDGVDFRLQRGDRMALLGPNGAGKTTLLKVLAGALSHEGGHRSLGHNVSLAYYAQHALDALDPRNTVLEEISGAADTHMQPQVRGILAAFLFDGEEWKKPVGVLSGGEKARLALAKLLLRPANLLLLDEPTNHLDLRSRGVLEQALADYSGTLCFISHDRYFINQVASSVCVVENGTLDVWLGNYDDYRDTMALRAKEQKNAGGEAGARAPGPAHHNLSREQTRAAAPEPDPVDGVTTAEAPRRLTRSEKQERKRLEAKARQRYALLTRPVKEGLESLEKKIADQERKLRLVEFELTQKSVYESPQKSKSAAQLQADIRRRLEQLNAEWEQQAEKLEGAESKLREEVDALTTD